MNSKEQGNGVGQPARAKERPGTRCWERQRGGEGRRDEKLANSLAKVNPKLLAPTHSHSFLKQRPNLRASSQGEGASLQPGRSKFRTEAGRPASQKGSDLRTKLVGLQV